MFSRVLTYLRSQVLGLVAIFIALGGTGYAAVAIPKHSIGQRQLKKNAVGRVQLREHSVTNGKLANASVSSTKLKAAAVTSSKLKAAAVTSSKLADGSVGSGQIAMGAVGSTQLAPGSVTAAQLANGSVGPTQIAASSVGPAQLSGIASYTSAFAIVGPTGTVSASDPAATTSNWSDGSGQITFASPVISSSCIPYAFAPDGASSGTSQVSASIFAQPTSGSEVAVTTGSPAGGTQEAVVVEVECAD